MSRGVATSVGAVLAAVTVVVGTAAFMMRDAVVPASPASAMSQDPESLVGSWWADGASVFDDRLLVLLPTGEATVYGSGDCMLMGSWSATASGLATLTINGAGGDCRRDLQAAYRMTEGVTRYRATDQSFELVDADGAAVLALTPATDVDQWPGAADAAELLPLLDEPYAGSPRAIALPAGLGVPMPAELMQGRWLPVTTVGRDYWRDTTRPHAVFTSGGTWSGADGCNGLGGRWSMDAATGEWLASTNGQTEIGCRNVDVSTMVATARVVGLDGDQLVFLDADGSELARFVAE